MNDAHAGERAALYALGALDDGDAAALEAHLRVCAECARLVGEAERDVDTIASLQTHRRAPQELNKRIERLLAPAPGRRTPWPAFAAVAAAFLVGVLPSAYLWERNRAIEDAMLSQAAAVDRLVATAHRTASFRPSRVALAANVMYASDGSWYVIVVRGAQHALQVAWMHDGEQTMLGDAVPHGGIAMLYLPKSHRMEQLALMDGPRMVAQARLPY
ncbi:MAG: zf-HC2 domain-containing protein [Candidatus Cybelea sp.]